jgi:hypothetical protein
MEPFLIQITHRRTIRPTTHVRQKHHPTTCYCHACPHQISIFLVNASSPQLNSHSMHRTRPSRRPNLDPLLRTKFLWRPPPRTSALERERKHSQKAMTLFSFSIADEQVIKNVSPISLPIAAAQQSLPFLLSHHQCACGKEHWQAGNAHQVYRVGKPGWKGIYFRDTIGVCWRDVLDTNSQF